MYCSLNKLGLPDITGNTALDFQLILQHYSANEIVYYDTLYM